MHLHGAHIVITGASSGIGRQFALDVLARGARVTSLERTAPVDAVPGWNSMMVDVRKEDDVRAAFARITDPIDILFSNAGIMQRGALLSSSSDDFDDLLATNVKGSWLTLKYGHPLLRPGATILQMSSRHALSMPVDPALYGLSKRWAMDLATVFAKQYPEFIVKILCPGPVDTPLAYVGSTPEGMEEKRKMMCTPAEISQKIIELLESSSKSRLLFDARTNTYFLE